MSSRVRRIAVTTVGVLGVLLSVVSLLAVWGRNQVLETDSYLGSVTPLATDPVIQDEVAGKVAAAINARLDAETFARESLPRRSRGLAPALAAATESFVESTTASFVHSEAFVTLWTELNRTGHDELVSILTGSPDAAVAVDDGELRLDLGQVVEAVRGRLADAGLDVVTRLPPITLVVDVADARGVERARAWVRLLDRVATWLPFVSVLLLAGAVALSARRWRTAYGVCLGVAAAMLVTRGLLALGSGLAADHVPAATASTAAVHAYYAHLTSLLRHGAAIVGVVFALVAALACAYPRLRATGGRWPEDDAARWDLYAGLALPVAFLAVLLTTPPLVVVVLVLLAVLLVYGVRRRRRSGEEPRLRPDASGHG